MASLGSSSAKVMLSRMVTVGVGFVCAPILSRMFDRDQYGVAGIVESMSYWAIGFAALGYSQAIPLSENEGEFRGLVRLNFVINAALVVVLSLLVLAFGDAIARWFGGGDGASALGGRHPVARLIWYLPALFLVSALSDTAQYAFSWQGRFGLLSWLVVSTGLSQPLQIVAGWLFGGTASMLLLGALLSGVTGAVIVCVCLVPQVAGTGGKAGTMRDAAWRRQQFPRVQLWNTVLLMTSYAMPVIAFGILFAASDMGAVGSFNRGRKLIMLPVMVLAISLGQVFYPQAADEWQRNRSARDSIMGTFRILSILCVFPTVCLCYLGPLMFSLFLGEQWREAGVYAQLCGPYVIFLIFAGPLKWMYLIRERTGRFFVYNVLTTIGEPVGLAVGALIGGTAVLKDLTGFGGFSGLDGARAAVLAYALAGSLTRAPQVVEAIRLGGVHLGEVVGIVAREIAVAMIVLLPAGAMYWAGGPDLAAVALACAAGLAYLAIVYRRDEAVRRWVARRIGWEKEEEAAS